ncbi:transcription factor bHLH61-like [Aristolochia californica]|uniref:transcription factor bHLH61-like n=1 Tax=Aristolochia californica TaxID=171875 RepID=UPI0035DAB45A
MQNPSSSSSSESKGKKEREESVETERAMVSREHKRAALYEKLQLLRSVTNSHALSKASIIVDASKYIEDLKQKVERLNQDIALEQTTSDQNLPVVTVETLERSFLINVFSDKSCPGLLVSLLETFEELGLNVIEARVSCEDTFHLEAVGGETQDQGENIDAQMIKQAVMQAIKTWSGSADED